MTNGGGGHVLTTAQLRDIILVRETKRNCGNGDALPRFKAWEPFCSSETTKKQVLGTEQILGSYTRGGKKPPRDWGHALPSFGGRRESSGVRRPSARPLGNLTTVGHLATHTGRVSPDLSPHSQTRGSPEL